jgi:hypothetical protein
MQIKYLRILGWFGAIFFFLFGSIGWFAVAAGSRDVLTIVVIMYAAAFLTWKYAATKSDVKSEEITAGMSAKMKKTIIYGCVIVFVMLLMLVANVLRNRTNLAPKPSGDLSQTEKNELLEKSVQSIRLGMTFPFKMDEYTTATDVTAEQGSIRYHLTLSGVNTEKISDEILWDKIQPMICQNEDAKDVLSQGINIEYSYSVENSSQKYFVTITEADCI